MMPFHVVAFKCNATETSLYSKLVRRAVITGKTSKGDRGTLTLRVLFDKPSSCRDEATSFFHFRGYPVLFDIY